MGSKAVQKKKTTSSAAQKSMGLAETAAPPKPVAAYNPLRPAAAGVKLAHASMSQAGKKAPAAPTEKGGAPVWSGPLRSLFAGGLKFEENVVGQEGEGTKLGDKVHIKFSVLNAEKGSKAKKLEHGELNFCLGESEG